MQLSIAIISLAIGITPKQQQQQPITHDSSSFFIISRREYFYLARNFYIFIAVYWQPHSYLEMEINRGARVKKNNKEIYRHIDCDE